MAARRLNGNMRPLNGIRDEIQWSSRCQEHFFSWRMMVEETMEEQQIAEAGISDLYPGYGLGRTRPRFHLVVFTTIGQGRLFCGGRTSLVKHPQVLIVPAGTPFGYRPHRGRWRFVWFHLPDNERWQHLRGHGFLLRKSFSGELIAHTSEGFLKESRGRGPSSQRAAALYGELIEIYVQREVGGKGGPAGEDFRNQLYELWDKVNADLRRPWTVEDLALEVGVSPSHFFRMTQEHQNTAPLKMVTRLRMERAQELLILHPHPIHIIAEMVGYRNEFAFSVAFKRFSGVSPGQFRKRR